MNKSSFKRMTKRTEFYIFIVMIALCIVIQDVYKRQDLERTKKNTEWFALNSVETSMELGKHMVQCALETLDKIIV